jgi:MFS family permease
MQANNNNNPLNITEFIYFLIARLFFVFAIRMIFTTVSYQLFELTSNTFNIGLAGLAEFIPALVAAFFAGSYIDRHNKKNILCFGYVAYFLFACVLIIISIPTAFISLSKSTMVIVLYMVMFATGIARSFVGPAANSMIAAIVSKNMLEKATSYNSTTWLLASILGHAFAGLLIAAFGIAGSYLTILVFIIIALVCVFKLKSKPPVLTTKKEGMLQSIRKGFSFVWHQKDILGVMSLDLFVVLFGGAVAFIPEVNKVILQQGAIGFGFLNAAMDLGGLLSIVLLIKFPMKKNQGKKMLISVAIFAACIIIFGVSRVYWLSFVALFCAGFFDGISMVVRGVVTQLNTPDELRGRVASINSIFINSSNELGAFESGLTSRWFGTLNAIIIGGIASLTVVGITYIKFPKLKKLEY